jgi:branched-chain amino acid transport system substrate-binding protein
MKKTTYLGSALVIAMTFVASGAMAQDKCGLGNGKKASGEPIQIGAIVGKTGPEDFSSSARAADAYFKCVNANGGINGRPIAYTIQDDTWNPEVASQAANKLVKEQIRSICSLCLRLSSQYSTINSCDNPVKSIM